MSSIKQHLRASSYVAAVIGISGLVSSFRLGAASIIIGVIGATIAFACAFLLSLPLLYARARLSEWTYFLIHIAVGAAVGALYAARNPYIDDSILLLTSAAAVLVNTASVAGWLYVALTVPPGRPGRFDVGATAGPWTPLILAIGLVVLPIPQVYAPMPEDDSCHNALRGSRTSVTPALILSFEAIDDPQALGIEYDRFAIEHALSRRTVTPRPESSQRSLCNEDVVISAGGTFGTGRHEVSVYVHEGGDKWEPLAADLICRLRSRWGDGMRLSGARAEDFSGGAYAEVACRVDQDE